MTTRSEKEKQKAQQEKFQAILSNLLKDDDNKYCVDCDAKGPRWASWNLGVFLCIRCAGIHRNLGVHISKVKSVNLDTWAPEQIAMMMEIGNSRARAAYEANLPDNYRRPQANGALESFIRAKYEQKKYMAKEWNPPKPSIPKELLDDEKDKKKTKPTATTKVHITSVPRVSSEPQMSTQSSKPSNPKPVQNSQPASSSHLQQPTSPPHKSSTTGDLIGLDAPTVTEKTSNSLLDDFMGSSIPLSSSQPVSQQNTSQVSNGGLEASLFGETSSTEKTPNVSTKDSIMALYGGQQSQPQFGVPGGVYMPPQQPQMYGMQQPHQMPQMHMQHGMYGNPVGMIGMPRGQGQMGMVGMGTVPQGQMGMQPGMGAMRQPQMAMYGQQQQPQMQQMQFQQMNQQMANMNIGQQQQHMGMGWGATSTSGHTLSTNLWQ